MRTIIQMVRRRKSEKIDEKSQVEARRCYLVSGGRYNYIKSCTFCNYESSVGRREGLYRSPCWEYVSS